VAETSTEPLRARALLAAIIASVRALGPLRRPVARSIGGVWFAVVPAKARIRAAVNHRRLQPALTHQQARALARRSYMEYVAMIFDAIWAEGQSPAAIRRLVHFTGMQHLAAGDAEGGVLAVCHFGNWDMAASAAMAIGRPLSTVMAPIGSELITSMVRVSRARKKLELFTPQQAARGLVRTLRRGRLVALMADVPEAGPTVLVPYCGGLVPFSAVPARIAAATAKPVIPVECWRDGGRWVVQFHPPIDAAAEGEAATMAGVAAATEPAVRRHPEQWYPFHQVYAD
jgi:lauroyl/myristoyl acyltransferase